MLELSVRIPPDLENDDDEYEARDSEFGHLMQYVGTRKRFHVMYDPAVKPVLEALLGPEFSRLRLNMDRPGTIGYEGRYLVVEGTLRAVSEQEFAEFAMLVVGVSDGSVHAGVETGGVRSIYSDAESWRSIPEPLRRWVHRKTYLNLVYGEGPPRDVVWVGGPTSDAE